MGKKQIASPFVDSERTAEFATFLVCIEFQDHMVPLTRTIRPRLISLTSLEKRIILTGDPNSDGFSCFKMYLKIVYNSDPFWARVSCFFSVSSHFCQAPSCLQQGPSLRSCHRSSNLGAVPLKAPPSGPTLVIWMTNCHCFFVFFQDIRLYMEKHLCIYLFYCHGLQLSIKAAAYSANKGK